MAYSRNMQSNQLKIILVVAILASFVTFLDGSVVGVALPAISAQLGGGLVIQQWINDAYLVTLGTLILAAGSLSDIFGRKKIMTIGLYGFLVTSILCAIAPTGEILIVARGLQGIAGALLVPSSLALIISSYSGPSQSKAIGTWTAWTGIAFVIGPLVGGLLVDLVSWRLVFAINVIPIAISLVMLRLLTMHADKATKKRVDTLGIGLGVVALGGIVYALIEQTRFGWGSPIIYGTFSLGAIAMILFLMHEKRTKQPMLPLELFSIRNFSIGNIATFFIYGALALQGFILVIFLQQVAHFSAVAAGLSSLPITIILFFLSSRFGALSGRFGPRLFMALGPIVAGSGVLLLLRVGLPARYLSELLPGLILFGLGLAATVAPLTSAILGSIQPSQAGIGSAINNAVSRIAGLLSIAAIGMFIGGSMTLQGFHTGLIICAGLLIGGGIISAIGITNQQAKTS
jgi:EmrB/QacA subfamily drug resistance transporter